MFFNDCGLPETVFVLLSRRVLNKILHSETWDPLEQILRTSQTLLGICSNRPEAPGTSAVGPNYAVAALTFFIAFHLVDREDTSFSSPPPLPLLSPLPSPSLLLFLHFISCNLSYYLCALLQNPMNPIWPFYIWAVCFIYFIPVRYHNQFSMIV